LQRASIARALISKPRLIVADEPVSIVDASLRMSIVNLFLALRDELMAPIVYTSGEVNTRTAEARQMSERLGSVLTLREHAQV
jgi:ABC-type oligopeptide transport system ATPase subunit